MAKRATRIAKAALAGLALGHLLVACTKEEAPYLQGYVEGEFVHVASPRSGQLLELAVSRGQSIEAGDLLFRLDPEPESLEAEETRQRLDQARAKLQDLRKGRRPSEIAALEARLASARAALEEAEHDYERRTALREKGHAEAISESELDRFRTARDVARSNVKMLEAELETAGLGGRPDTIAAAESEVGALQIQMQELDWRVRQKEGRALAAGVVHDTLYLAGEFVAGGRPVVSVLSTPNVKVRFFVPEALLPTITLGDPVELQCDGIEERLQGSVSFMAANAEFTPPVIYSKDNRAKLVYLVEALPDPGVAVRLRPGQPVEVYLGGSR